MEKMENVIEHVQGIEHQSKTTSVLSVSSESDKGSNFSRQEYIQGIQLAWGLKDNWLLDTKIHFY